MPEVGLVDRSTDLRPIIVFRAVVPRVFDEVIMDVNIPPQA